MRAPQKKRPTLRDVPKGDPQLLPGKMAGLFDVRCQQWRYLQFHPHQNEKVGACAFVADLPAQTLILADLGYFGLFDWLTAKNDYGLSRLRQDER